MAKRSRQEEDRIFLKSILDHIPDMIFVKESKSLRFVRFNKAGEKLLGRPQKALIGKNDYDFFPKKEADFFIRKDRAVLKKKRLLDIPEEFIHTRKKGIRILHTKKIPLRDSAGKIRYLLGISEDITARRHAEKTLKKTYEELEARVASRTAELVKTNKDLHESQSEIQKLNEELEQKVDRRTSELKAAIGELESFSYSVSHDLRAPLRAIEGFAQILAEDYSDTLHSEAKRLLKVIQKNTRQMSQLIDDLLAFSRVARKDFMKRRVPMRDLAKVVAEDLQQGDQGSRCAITVGALPDAFGDTPLLRQVWTNLLTNAIKFTRLTTSPRIDITAEEDGDATTYTVADNGVGFDMQFADKLFGVFQRLHSAAEFEGTGVGLAIVHRIILKHGGKIWAEGRVNEGSRFHFSLPKQKKTA